MITKMKRTKNIRHDRFRKAWHFGKASIIVIASTGALVACDEVADQDVAMYKNADDCSRAHPSESAQCKSAYDNAMREADRTGPKYANQKDCEQDFSSDQCHYSSSSTHWMPYPYGYMYGNTGSHYAQPLYSSSRPGSGMYRQAFDAQGKNYGSAISGRNFKTSRTAFVSRPTSATITRGGFGRSVSAHASSSHSSGG